MLSGINGKGLYIYQRDDTVLQNMHIKNARVSLHITKVSFKMFEKSRISTSAVDTIKGQ